MTAFAIWAFSAWLLLTIANQFPLLARRIPFRGATSLLLPNWKFFAPEPGSSDVRHAYRESTGKEWSSWTEIAPPERSAVRSVWNPSKFDAKALCDLACFLSEDATGDFAPALALSWPYLALLGRTEFEASGSAVKVQFALL